MFHFRRIVAFLLLLFALVHARLLGIQDALDDEIREHLCGSFYEGTLRKASHLPAHQLTTLRATLNLMGEKLLSL